MGWMLRVFQSGQSSLMLADTLEISRHSPIRVLLPALESIWKSKDIYKLSKQFNERLRTTSLKYSTYTTGKDCTNQIVLAPETPRTLYNYIYLEDNTAYGEKY